MGAQTWVKRTELAPGVNNERRLTICDDSCEHVSVPMTVLWDLLLSAGYTRSDLLPENTSSTPPSASG